MDRAGDVPKNAGDHLIRMHEEQMHDHFIKKAGNHFGANSLFEPLPYNPALYSFQRFDSTFIEGKPAPYSLLELYAESINRGAIEAFNQAVESDYPSLIEHIHQIRTNENKNIIVITNHGELHDIAMVVGLLRTKYEAQYPSDGIDQRTGIVISKGIGVFNVPILGKPAVEIVREIGDVFLSIPRTETFKDIDEDIRNTFNKGMLTKLYRWLDVAENRPGLLAVVPSGSKDEKGILKPASSSTLKLMCHSDSYVLPVSVVLKDNEPPKYRIFAPQNLKNSGEATVIMHLLAAGVESLTGEDTRYAENGTVLAQLRSGTHNAASKIAGLLHRNTKQ